MNHGIELEKIRGIIKIMNRIVLIIASLKESKKHLFDLVSCLR
jgi:hypothetical protein